MIYNLDITHSVFSSLWLLAILSLQMCTLFARCGFFMEAEEEMIGSGVTQINKPMDDNEPRTVGMATDHNVTNSDGDEQPMGVEGGVVNGRVSLVTKLLFKFINKISPKPLLIQGLAESSNINVLVW